MLCYARYIRGKLSPLVVIAVLGLSLAGKFGCIGSFEKFDDSSGPNDKFLIQKEDAY